VGEGRFRRQQVLGSSVFGLCLSRGSIMDNDQEYLRAKRIVKSINGFYQPMRLVRAAGWVRVGKQGRSRKSRRKDRNCDRRLGFRLSAAGFNVDAVGAFDEAIDPPILIFDACDVPLRVLFPDRYQLRVCAAVRADIKSGYSGSGRAAFLTSH
jgi:hypothetical protein